ncbi:hypothetical protein QNH98_11790 [Myroides sp. mNGS23_01]|nr:hypothetical protein [Myroides sp. mNGS23_01]WHT37827.1 hypothetical protein QNH98_11790 [Myroides sp. mNGS23_01]
MNYSLEIIRLLAVILITFTHTKNDFSTGITQFVFHELPLLGTVLLSLTSGFLYYKVSKNKNNLLRYKIKTLLIPYFVANVLILGLVLFAYFVFHQNYLQRLTFDSTLFTEGILALHSPPINPPTYFIRDLFLVFVCIEMIKNRNTYLFIGFLLLFLFGKPFLRLDIPLLFAVGLGIAHFSNFISHYRTKILLALLGISLSIWVFQPSAIEILKFPISLFIFIYMINRNLAFYNVGAYTYLLHLYHVPFIVVSYPLLNRIVQHPFLNAGLQVIISLALTYMLFLITRKYKSLRFICGGK